MTRYAKTVIAILLAVSTWGTTAALDGAFDPVELFGLLGATATAAGVFLVPNTNPGDKPYDPMISEREAGHIDSTTVLLIVIAAIAVVALLVSTGVL